MSTRLPADMPDHPSPSVSDLPSVRALDGQTADTGEVWRDPKRPASERVDDLLSRLSTAEKVALLHQHGPAVPRLGLAAFRTGTEALHGVAWLGEATVFPQAVGLGATWNPALVEEVGTVTSIEVRAKHAKDPTVSLNVWAPVVNLLRDPRWGRNEEGYSEDPLHASRMAIAFCRGLRGDHPGYVRTAPTLKHFIAYNNETRRSETSSNVPARVLHEYDLPAFELPIRAGVVDAVMPAYNLINGRPCHVTGLLGLLRTWAQDTDHDLAVVSDAEAPSNLVESQHAYPDHPTGHAAALRAGVDSFTDHDTDSAVTIGRFSEALERGLITIEDVDRAVRRLLALRLRTGEFDPGLDPYASIGPDALHRPEHRELALRAAREQVVLLRNEGDLLPLEVRSGQRVAVIGPFADTVRPDHYSGSLPYRVTVLDGAREALQPVGADLVTAGGLDRITLRARSTGDRVVVDGSALVLSGSAGPEENVAQFEVADWGEGVQTLRSAATGLFISGLTPGEVLTADAERPSGWEVSETFTLSPADDDATADGDEPGYDRPMVIRQVRTGAYVRITADGRSLVADTDDTQEAERFTVERVHDGVAEALGVVAGVQPADHVVLVLGSDPYLKARETLDRSDLALPPSQERLLRAVTAAHPSTVVVLMSSYPYALGDVDVPALVWTSHAGQETGHALSDILLGEHAPVGRLPQTWYRSDADLPDLLDYDIIGARRTYQYFTGDALFPFGHGLSYTTFGYEPVTADLVTQAAAEEGAGVGETVQVRVRVTNTGDRDGVEVVQVYTRQVTAEGGPVWSDVPRRRLAGFERVHLEPGASADLALSFPVTSLARWDPAVQQLRVEPGRYEVLVGRSSEAIMGTATVDVAGTSRGPRDLVSADVLAVHADLFEGVEFVAAADAGEAVAVPAGAGRAGRLLFKNAALPAGPCRLVVDLAEGGSAGRIRLLLDDPDSGRLLAGVDVPASGADRSDEARFTGPGAVADVWLVVAGALRLNSFRLVPLGPDAVSR